MTSKRWGLNPDQKTGCPLRPGGPSLTGPVAVLTAGSHPCGDLMESSAISTPHTAFGGHLMDYGADGLELSESHWVVVTGFQGLWTYLALYGEHL